MNQESGFLFLPDCEIQFLSGQKTSLCTSDSFWDSSWWPVSFSTSSFDRRGTVEVKESSCCDSERYLECCPHCYLAVECRDDGSLESSLSLVEPSPRFDGRIVDVKPIQALCTCQERLHQRTDGALLVGLALTCQELGHVQIHSIEVMFKVPPTLDHETSSGVHQSRPSSRNLRGSLTITISIPEVQTRQSYHGHQDRTTKRRYMTNSMKPLPPSTQLLLSLLRTDWKFLESIKTYPQRPIHHPSPPLEMIRRQPLPLFPSDLALDEVYRRIGGASDSTFGKKLEIGVPFQSSTTDALTCYDLPNDIWQHHIGTFLRAKTLDSLRCSCKHFHRILQPVVPGLKLRLFTHQIRSLSWMRRREARCITENEMVSRPELSLESDIHSAATGGSTVLLQSRDGKQTVRISQQTGEEVVIRTDDPLSRTMARGGLLCDDPGLGKTVTVLSLILQTFGLSTQRLHEEQEQKEDDVALDERIFREYWREQSIPAFRAQALNRLLSTFIRVNRPDVALFMYPVDPVRDGVPNYLEVIAKPMCLQVVRKQIERHHYDPEFVSFEEDVLLCFRNAMTYHPTDSAIHKLASLLMDKFHDTIAEFKAQQVISAKKSFSKAAAKPNSAVAALVETNERANLQKALVPSSGTLLVVPSVLLEHWEDQIRFHIDLGYCTDKIPVTFEFTGTASNNLRLEEIVRQCKIDETHMPFLFVDKSGARKLPSPQFLSMFAIVITTNQRFTNEWKNGSFEGELRQQASTGRGRYRGGDEYELKSPDTESDEACPILKVKWLRMIVDEGHSMGRGSMNSAIWFASWISSERRWAMTGTPTRQVISQSGLTDLAHLMNYIQHDFFSRRRGGELVWKNMISHGWGQGALCSFFRLRKLLDLLMVRHTKKDILELPLPKYQSREMSMGTAEVKTYNTLVSAVQSNLAITSMEGKTSGLQDSLLHRSQSKHARKALRNVRLVCVGGIQVLPTITMRYWTEFLADFGMYNPDDTLKGKMERYLSRATTEQVTPCDCCGILLTTLLVVPCGDLVCTECFDSKSNKCVVCDKEFDVDVFQKLQPGMDYQWLHNIQEEAKKRKGSTMSDFTDSESASGVMVLDDGRGILAPAADLADRGRTAKPGDGHVCVYSPRRTDGQCELCWKEHDYCNLLHQSGRCQVCHRTAQSCPEFETKPSFVVQKLVSLYREKEKQESYAQGLKASEKHATSSSTERRPLKVIVFSQFRNVLDAVGDRLIRRCGTACVAEYWGSHRRKALRQFAKDKQCFCMLLGKDGSEGLDLSFVTNLIFLEQVYDKSLEEQVVARAWRMGAKGPVEVETLVARESVEELMSRLDSDLHRGLEPSEMQGIQAVTEKDAAASEYQSAKLHFLLKNLRLITSPDTCPLIAGSDLQKTVLSDSAPESSVGDCHVVKVGKKRVCFDQGST